MRRTSRQNFKKRKERTGGERQPTEKQIIRAKKPERI